MRAGRRNDRQGRRNPAHRGSTLRRVRLTIVGVGLLAYAAWRLLCGAMDLEHEGDRPTGLAKRIGYVASGALYASAGMFALKLLTGNGGGSGDDGAATWTSRLMDAPGGTLLVVLAGLGIAGGGLDADPQRMERGVPQAPAGWAMRSEPKRWAVRLGKWGYIARGIVFSTIGLFVDQCGHASRSEPGPWTRRSARRPCRPTVRAMVTGVRGRRTRMLRRLLLRRSSLPAASV